MKQRKTLTLIAAALLALLPLAVIAEPPGDRQRGPGRGHGPGRGMFPPPGYLDLTDEQIEAAQAVRESVRAEMEAGREEQRALHEQLEATLDGDNPDAATVGQMVIELRTMRRQKRVILEDAESRFAALLNAEQLEKWENFKELRKGRRENRREHRRGVPAADSADSAADRNSLDPSADTTRRR